MAKGKTSNSVYLDGGGEMGELVRSFNWAATSLGPPESWPPSLLRTVNILLSSRFPMLLWWGRELIQFYNDGHRPSMSSSGKHPAALGQRGEDCWPEIWHIFKPLIDQVLAGGESVWRDDERILVSRNGAMEEMYWSFSFSRIIDDKGQTAGVLAVCKETTEKVLNRRRLMEINEKLHESNERLQALNTTLQEKILELEEKDARIHLLVDQEIVAIASLTGRDLIIESANDVILKIWGKPKSIIGRPLGIALPELEGQPFLGILDEVFTSGKPYFGHEMVAYLDHGNRLHEGFFNFTYQPLKNDRGQTRSILIIATEVTEHVKAREAILDAIHNQREVLDELRAREEHLRLAREAAGLGTFDMDLIKGTMEWDTRCRELFGITHLSEVSYDRDFLGGLHPDDRLRIEKIIEKIIRKQAGNGDYDVEYRTVSAKDKRVRWVRAKGKVFFDEEGRAIRFIGSVLEITDKKLDELRKNDFIAMVRREIKAPPNSVKAYLKLLAEASGERPVEVPDPKMLARRQPGKKGK